MFEKKGITKKKLTEILSFISNAKNINEFAFIDDILSEFKNDGIEFLSQFIDRMNTISSVDYSILDEYYKSDSKKSIKIVRSNVFDKLIATTQPSQLKSKVMSGRVKSVYIKNKNLNFFNLCSEDNKVEFHAFSREKLEKEIFYCRVAQIKRNGRYITGTYYIEPKDSDSNEKIIEKAIMSKIAGITIPSNSLAEFNNMMFMKILQDQGMAKKDKMKSIEKILLSKIGVKMSVSLAINSTFDNYDLVMEFIKKYTKVIQVFSKNPITGATMVKNKRVPIELNEGNNDLGEIKKAAIEYKIDEFISTNKFFEDMASTMKAGALLGLISGSDRVKLVKGEDITTLYNMSSYVGAVHRNGKLVDGCDAASTGGSLFGSCMRGSGIKPRLTFYANNPEFVRMIVSTDATGKFIESRALAWYDSETDTHYVDRIFSTTEESKINILKYILSHDRMILVHDVTGSNILPVDKKSFRNFAIKYNGCIKGQASLPYFDTMYKTVLIKNDELFIGKVESIEGGLSSRKSNDGKYYDTGIGIQDLLKMDDKVKKNFIESLSRVCMVSKRKLNAKYVKAKNGSINLTNILLDKNGNKYAVGGTSFCYIGEDDGKINLVRRKAFVNTIRITDVDKNMLYCESECTSICNSTLRLIRTLYPHMMAGGSAYAIKYNKNLLDEGASNKSPEDEWFASGTTILTKDFITINTNGSGTQYIPRKMKKHSYDMLVLLLKLNKASTSEKCISQLNASISDSHVMDRILESGIIYGGGATKYNTNSFGKDVVLRMGGNYFTDLPRFYSQKGKCFVPFVQVNRSNSSTYTYIPLDCIDIKGLEDLDEATLKQLSEIKVC